MKMRKTIFIILFTICMLFLGTVKSEAGLYLNNLDFTAQINEDGSMDVVESWDIDITGTNTLYKTFEIDKSKYSSLKDISVTEITKGINKTFQETKIWEYHIDKNYYFGGINNDGQYEIAWGVGLDNSSDTRTYLVRYTVEDAIKKYGDCSELYWQFVGQDFEVSANSITGTIKLPNSVSNKEELKVWGHTKYLNGEIYATDEKTVEFKVNNYTANEFVEVRIAMPNYIMEELPYTLMENRLENIIEEETAWSEEANAIRKRTKVTKTVLIIIVCIISIFVIKHTIKLIVKLRKTKKCVPTEKYEYFREKATNNGTPGDALFLYNKGMTTSTNFLGRVFSATLLNLSLKGYFKITVEKNKKGKEEATIYKVKENTEELNYEEEKIAKFMLKMMETKEKITIRELKKYMYKNAKDVIIEINKIEVEIERRNKNRKKFDKKACTEKEKYKLISMLYLLLMSILIYLNFFYLPLSVLCFINSVLCFINMVLSICISKKLNRLTQKGIDEREKWKGLKKYMKEFSLLNEKEIPSIEIWEEYLVYATVFGIADKVIKQLKIVYPQINEMDSLDNMGSYVYLMSHTNFNSIFSNLINSSISSTMSSGSGSGGGFSGGGGGRRPVAEAGGGR